MHHLFALLLCLTLVGCVRPAPTMRPLAPSPTLSLPLSPVASPTPTLVGSTGGEAVLAGCPVASQLRPLRDGERLDLAALGFDLCYDLHFALDEAGDAFDAGARVTVVNGSGAPWPDLLFRLYPAAPVIFGGQIEVSQVRVAGAAVEAERTLQDETGLRVPLPAPLLPGQSVVVEMAFRGELARGVGGDKPIYGVFARTPSAATIASWFPLLAVWDESKGNWYDVPVLGEGDAVFAESALIQATVAAPARFDLAVSGTILSRAEADGYTTYEVATGPARELTMVWMEGYQSEEAVVEGVTLRTWYRPGDERGARRALAAARESLPLFDARFGRYPFEEVEIVEVPLAGAGGVEYPQLYLLGQELYQDDASLEFLGIASAHELAHQWWYSTVGNDINGAPWQDEALTNWSETLWLEGQGEQVARSYLQSYEQAVRGYERREGEEPIAQPLANFQGRSMAYSTIVYLKGTLFFAALREEIGDDAFFRALQDYYADYRFAIAAPSDLLVRFEQESGRDLDALYEAWGVVP